MFKFRYILPLLLVIPSVSVAQQATDAVSEVRTYEDWVSLSFDYIEQDSIQQAEECIQNAMRLEPANAQNGLLFCNLGTIQRQLGKLAEAEVSYSCAIALQPETHSIRASRAQLYAEMERWTDAIVDYEAALDHEPQQEDWIYECAMCRLMNGDIQGARRDLEGIDTFNPNSAKARKGMAVVYKTTGEYSLAMDLYNALIEANPKSWSLLRDRAEVHYLSNRMGAAMQDINRSIEISGNDPMQFVLRAQIRYARGDKEYARRDINKALDLGLPQQIAQNLLQKYK